MAERALEDRLRDALRTEAADVVPGPGLDERIARRRAELGRTNRTRRALVAAAALVAVVAAVAVVLAVDDDRRPPDELRTVDSTPGTPAAGSVLLRVTMTADRIGGLVSQEGELLRWAIVDSEGSTIGDGPLAVGGTAGVLPGLRTSPGPHRFVVESFPCVEVCPDQDPHGRPANEDPGTIFGSADPARPVCTEPFEIAPDATQVDLEASVEGDTCRVAAETARRAGEAAPRAEGWTRLPDPPLEPRSAAITAWTGNQLLVVGGTTLGCAPNVECVPVGEAFRDGAALDPTSGRWRHIADAPWSVSNLPTAVVDGDLYLLRSFCQREACDTTSGTGLVRYRPDVDRWERLADLPEEGHQSYALAAASGVLVAYPVSDELGEVPDLRYDDARDRWETLPDDPLPYVFDRTLSADGEWLYLFGTSPGEDGANDGPSSKLGARFDLASGRWTRLPDAPAGGYQAWLVDGTVVVNPHFGQSSGGVFDTAVGTWASLPSLDEPTWNGDMAGVLGPTSAVVETPSGWVLDTASDRWVRIPPSDGRERLDRAGITTIGRSLVVVGGEEWDGSQQDPVGRLHRAAWIWTAPRPS